MCYGALDGIVTVTERGRSFIANLRKGLTFGLAYVPAQLVVTVLWLVIGAPQLFDRF